jgi:uncharacterized protein
MTIITTVSAQTALGDKYIRQLVKHWSHKFATSYVDGVGVVPFGDNATAEFSSDDAGLTIKLSTADAEEARRLQGVIERHIDRFAFREAPLSYHWTEPQ